MDPRAEVGVPDKVDDVYMTYLVVYHVYKGIDTWVYIRKVNYVN